MCDQTQGLPAQQIAPASPVPFRSRETPAFPHGARMQSKRLSKCADEEGKQAIRLLRPKEKAVGLCLPRRAEERRGAEGASCRIDCRASERAISCPTNPGNSKQLDAPGPDATRHIGGSRLALGTGLYVGPVSGPMEQVARARATSPSRP